MPATKVKPSVTATIKKRLTQRDKLKNKFEKLWLKIASDVPLKAEYLFAYPRKYKADYAHCRGRILIDLQGGVWLKGQSGHSSGTGITKDCERLFLAQELGYKLFYLTEPMITEEKLQIIADMIRSRK